MELRPERVDNDGTRTTECGLNLAAVGKVTGTWRGGERAWRIAFGGSGLDRSAFGCPLVVTTVQNASRIEAHRFEHPPKTRCPHHRADAVQDHMHAGTDAMPAKGRRKRRRRRHHETKRRVLI